MFHEAFSGYLTYILFGVGFFFLIKGADVLIEGASSLAKRFGVSTFLIGLTIVTLGTTLPEFFVSVQGALHQNSEVVLGNVLGSNVANILLILGLMAVFSPVFIGRKIVRTGLPIAFIAIFVLLILANNLINGGMEEFALSREDGIILLVFFSLFMYFVFRVARKGQPRKEVEETLELVEPTAHRFFKPIAYVLLGVAGLWLGSDWIVDGAVAIASFLGVSQVMISLTIVAVGTSIPELTVAITAFRKKIADMAVGNLIGANIFNIFWALAVSVLINPIHLGLVRNFDVGSAMFATLITFAFLYISGRVMGRRYEIKRWQGVAMLVAYIVFVVITVLRG